MAGRVVESAARWFWGARTSLGTVLAAALVAVLPSASAFAGDFGGMGRMRLAPTTIAVTKGPIYALAQDRGRLAWIEARSPLEECGGTGAHVVTLKTRAPTGRTRVVLPLKVCSAGDHWVLALADRRVVYVDAWSGMSSYRGVSTIAVGEQRPTDLDDLILDPYFLGNAFADAAGDGSVLAYSVIGIGCEREDPRTGDCAVFSEETASKRVVGAAKQDLPGAFGYRIDVAAPYIASLSYPGETACASRSLGVQCVDVRNALNGAPVTSFGIDRVARDIALTGRFLVVLTAAGIEIYETGSGRLVRTIPVKTRRKLSASERGILYVVGKDIYVISLPAFVARKVARAARSGPRGLLASIEGSRVVWVEPFRHGSRIRAVSLR